MIIIRMFLFLFLFCLTSILALFCDNCRGGNFLNSIKRVAHAGGGYQGNTYTNSLEALDYNFSKGFEFFEIDFSWTKDGYLVCLHNWSDSFEKIFNFKTTEKPSLETFKFLAKQASPYQPCTLDDLKIWLKNNPKAKIVTDLKKDNLKALTVIAQQIEDFQNRIIPQCYLPENYPIIRQLGYKNIIWTLYNYPGNNQDVLRMVEKIDQIFAITMPPSRAKAGLAHALLAKNIPSYVHTINVVEQLDKSTQELGITEIYTDFLAPAENTALSESKITSVEAPLIYDCMASYSLFEGTFHIPCFSIPDSSNPSSVYEVQMQQQFPEYVFKLDLSKLKVKQH